MLFKTLIHQILFHTQQFQTRQQLKTASLDTLRDIGVTEAQRKTELKKTSFWGMTREIMGSNIQR